MTTEIETITTLPAIHMNGTSAETLLECYVAAHRACRDALEVIRKIEFNARDYYVKDGAWELAKDEHQAQFRAVHNAAEFYLRIAEHCADAVCERDARRNRS